MTAAVVEPFDSDAWITECLRQGQSAFGLPLGKAIAHCRWCRHEEHGLACGSCRCDSAFTSRDDSWRPLLPRTLATRRAEFMAETGVDGWVAQVACCYPETSLLGSIKYMRSIRVHNSLLGLTA